MRTLRCFYSIKKIILFFEQKYPVSVDGDPSTAASVVFAAVSVRLLFLLNRLHVPQSVVEVMTVFYSDSLIHIRTARREDGYQSESP